MNIHKFLTDTSVNTQGHKMKCTQCSDIKPTIYQLCYGNRKPQILNSWNYMTMAVTV
jgi:hypothetical protein